MIRMIRANDTYDSGKRYGQVAEGIAAIGADVASRPQKKEQATPRNRSCLLLILYIGPKPLSLSFSRGWHRCRNCCFSLSWLLLEPSLWPGRHFSLSHHFCQGRHPFCFSRVLLPRLLLRFEQTMLPEPSAWPKDRHFCPPAASATACCSRRRFFSASSARMSSTAACAADKRAIGTRNGEQLT